MRTIELKPGENVTLGDGTQVFASELTTSIYVAGCIEGPCPGNRLKSLRKILKLRQKAFMGAFGFTQSYISSLERGEYQLMPATAAKAIALAKSHGVEVHFDDFYTGCEFWVLPKVTTGDQDA